MLYVSLTITTKQNLQKLMRKEAKHVTKESTQTKDEEGKKEKELLYKIVRK